MTTRIHEGALPSLDGNVRGRRCARVCGRGYETRREKGVGKGRGGTEKLKHREENIRDSRGTA